MFGWKDRRRRQEKVTGIYDILVYSDYLPLYSPLSNPHVPTTLIDIP